MPLDYARLLTAVELSQKMSKKLHPKTILRHARDGWMPAKRIGRQWYFDLDEVEKSISENKTRR